MARTDSTVHRDSFCLSAPDVDPEPDEDADAVALPIVEDAVVALAAPTAGV